MEESQKSEVTFGVKAKKWFIKKKNSFVSDFKENTECHVIIIGNILYFLIFLVCDLFMLNKPMPKSNTEVIGLIFLFRIICVFAFIFFAVKLRKISYDNRGWAKWLFVIAAFATFVTFGSCVGYGWVQVLDLLAELPLLGVSVYIMIKHHKDERGY